MQVTRHNALLRVQIFCAKILRKARRKPAVKGSTLPPLTPHIARDIGLSPSELELLRHRLPSQTTWHPYL